MFLLFVSFPFRCQCHPWRRNGPRENFADDCGAWGAFLIFHCVGVCSGQHVLRPETRCFVYAFVVFVRPQVREEERGCVLMRRAAKRDEFVDERVPQMEVGSILLLEMPM